MPSGMMRACLTVALATVVAGTVLAQAADPQVGTWKLNVAKSTYSLGRRQKAPLPRSKRRAEEQRSSSTNSCPMVRPGTTSSRATMTARTAP
jgi:hypothetical protein